jgi:hypothetical protein
MGEHGGRRLVETGDGALQIGHGRLGGLIHEYRRAAG